MDEKQKQEYLEKYRQEKQKGVKFWPDIIYKDLVVSFALFIILVMLAIFVGVASEPKADPSDSTYVPRPEWYFLFLFQLLKYFPGELEWVGTTIIPGLAVLALFLLPLIDRNPHRHWKKRPIALAIMTVVVLGMVALTIIAAATTPSQKETGAIAISLPDKITAGQELFSIQCVECHGAEGEGGEVKGVTGLEGKILKPINSSDEMYTRSDETLFNIINYGQPDSGMPGFGKAYGGELSLSDIENIVTFMRYTWDDRAELPKEVTQGGAIPTLGPNEVPNFETHIQPIIKKYCISCHRPGKSNNNYTMDTYENMMTSGDHAPNVIAVNLNSNLIRMLHREEIDAGGAMPPSKALKPELVQMFELWVRAGAPKTAAEAGTVAVPVVTTAVTVTVTAPASIITPLPPTNTAPPAAATLVPAATATATAPATMTPLPTMAPTKPVEPDTPIPPPDTPSPIPTPTTPPEVPTPTPTSETPYPPPS